VSINFTPERMAEIALPVMRSVQDRIYAGLNASDEAANLSRPPTQSRNSQTAAGPSATSL